MIIKKMFKQKYTGPLIGHLKLTYSYTAPYINFATNIYVMMILYKTTLQHHFWAKLDWAPGLIPFMVTMIACYFLAGLLFVRRYDMPSTMGVNMDMQYKFSKEFREDLKEIKNAVTVDRPLVHDGHSWVVKRYSNY